MATDHRGRGVPDNHSNWMGEVRRQMFDWTQRPTGIDGGFQMHLGKAQSASDVASYGSVVHGRPGKYGNVTWKGEGNDARIISPPDEIDERTYNTIERAQQSADLKRNADIRRESGMMPARPKSTGKYKK